MNQIDYRYLRPRKADCTRAFFDGYADRSGELRVRSAGNVCIRPMGQSPGVAQTPERIIDDCDYYAEIRNSGTCTDFPGKTLYGGYLRKNWGHFLLNSTARLWPLFSEGFTDDYDRIVFFAEDPSVSVLKGNFREFLELAGIFDRCVVLLPKPCCFSRIDIADISLEIGRTLSNEFMRIFDLVRKNALDGSTPGVPQTDIILSRKNWNSDTQIGIGLVERLFTSAGYLSVSPEKMSLRDLIARLDNASEIVSFSGSTAHNLLFCRHKKFIQLERSAANNAYQPAVIRMTGSKSVYIDCFYQPMLTSSTDSLTIYGFTPQLLAFAADRGIRLPDGVSETDEASAGEFRRYLRIYRRHYGYAPGLNPWEEAQLQAVAEAYFASRPRYARMLDGRWPVLWPDFFSPRIMIRALKDMIARRHRSYK